MLDDPPKFILIEKPKFGRVLGRRLTPSPNTYLSRSSPEGSHESLSFKHNVPPSPINKADAQVALHGNFYQAAWDEEMAPEAIDDAKGLINALQGLNAGTPEE